MGIDLQALYSLADGVEEPQSQQERHHPWAQEIELLRKLGVSMIDKEQDLDKPRMFPELELTEEPRRMPYLEDDSTRYSDGTPKPAKSLKR